MDFRIAVDGHRILLSGDLVDSGACYDQIAQALNKLRPIFFVGAYEIEARAMTLDPPAVEMWIRAAQVLLQESRLSYAPSQLALILENDDRYQHGSSTFADSYEAI